MSLRVNQDGKFFDRVIAAFAGAAPVLIIGAVMWWADSRQADSKAVDAITRMERRIDAVEGEAREARKSADLDRQKTIELAGDVRNVLRSTARIEAILDRLYGMPSPGRP